MSAAVQNANPFRSKEWMEFKMSRRGFWSGYQTWTGISEEDRRAEILKIYSALLVHSGYTSIVLKHQIRQLGGQMLTRSAEEEIYEFISLAAASDLVRGKKKEQVTIFSFFGHLISCFPEFETEEGPITEGMTTFLKALLIADVDWEELHFPIDTFRCIYQKLVSALKLGEHDMIGGNEMLKSVKAIMSLGCFVTAILVALFEENEYVLLEFIPGFEAATTVEPYLELLIRSSLFKNVSYVLLTGFWFMVRNRDAGGYVTHCSSRPVPVDTSSASQQRGKTAEELRQRCFDILPFLKAFNGQQIKGNTATINEEWLAFIQTAVENQLIIAPPGFPNDSREQSREMHVAATRDSHLEEIRAEPSSSGTFPQQGFEQKGSVVKSSEPKMSKPEEQSSKPNVSETQSLGSRISTPQQQSSKPNVSATEALRPRISTLQQQSSKPNVSATQALGPRISTPQQQSSKPNVSATEALGPRISMPQQQSSKPNVSATQALGPRISTPQQQSSKPNVSATQALGPKISTPQQQSSKPNVSEVKSLEPEQQSAEPQDSPRHDSPPSPMVEHFKTTVLMRKMFGISAFSEDSIDNCVQTKYSEMHRRIRQPAQSSVPNISGPEQSSSASSMAKKRRTEQVQLHESSEVGADIGTPNLQPPAPQQSIYMAQREMFESFKKVVEMRKSGRVVTGEMIDNYVERTYGAMHRSIRQVETAAQPQASSSCEPSTSEPPTKKPRRDAPLP